MLTVMAGSAHSKFETGAIPSGEGRRLRYLRPFDRDLFARLIADKDSVRAPWFLLGTHVVLTQRVRTGLLLERALHIRAGMDADRRHTPLHDPAHQHARR
jgi:hypothetical protein